MFKLRTFTTAFTAVIVLCWAVQDTIATGGISTHNHSLLYGKQQKHLLQTASNNRHHHEAHNRLRHHLMQTKQQQQQERQLQNDETITGWIPRGQTIVGEAASDRAGFAVAMSADGSRWAVSAIKNDSGGTDSGNVQVWDYDPTDDTWKRTGNDIVGPAGSEAGQTIALSPDGATLAIGSYAISPFTGFVRVYRLTTANQWQQLGSQLNGISERDRFGASLSFSENGNRLAVGSPFHDGNDQIRGKVQVYQFDGVDWSQLGSAIDGLEEGDKSHVVALNYAGTVLAIGAPTNNGSGRNSGSVRVFRKTGSTSDWVQIGSKINGATENDQSGAAVSLSQDGTIIGIGSPFHSAVAGAGDVSGHVRVFSYSAEDNEWSQIGSDINAEAVGGRLGTTVALNGNGFILVAGAPYTDLKGQVRVYQYASNGWELGGVIDGSEDEERYGASLSISADGTDLVVGAPGSSANGELSGAATAYTFINNAAPGWSIQFTSVSTNFGGVDEDTPELVFNYDGQRPSDDDEAASYRLIMLTTSCVLGEANDDAISPVSPTGTVPATDTFTLMPQLDIDTSQITSSTYYFSSGDGMGMISFCLRVEIFVGDEVKAFESADVSLEIDRTTGFEVTSFQTNRRPSVIRVSQEAQFNYTLDTFFCDDNALDIGTDTREVLPGEVVSICLSTPNDEGAEVVDVQSVSFENAFAPLLGIALIDSEGTPRQSTTIKECGDGKCRVAAMTVPQLYEYTDGNGNTIDVSQGVFITGTVVYDFARRRLNGNVRNLQLPDKVKSRFSLKMKLARPPDRSSASFQSMGLSMLAVWVASVGGIFWLGNWIVC